MHPVANVSSVRGGLTEDRRLTSSIRRHTLKDLEGENRAVSTFLIMSVAE